MSFKECNLDNRLLEALKKQGITNPVGVQTEVIQKVLEGIDIIAQSETGSGKTLAYLLPIFERCKAAERTNQVIILVPTHELAMQVFKQSELLAKNSGITLKAISIIGNVKIERQIERLKDKPQIIVGTAGRILELIKKRKIAAHNVKTIVLDEADKLLDENNLDAVQAVIKCTLRERQVILFSASMTKSAVNTARGMLHEPVLIGSGNLGKIPDTIEHRYLLSERRDKLEMVRKYIHAAAPAKAMIFMNKASDIEELTHKLIYHGYSAECLHGSNIKKDRKRVVDAFQSGAVKYLLATDIAARGLHFEGIDTILHISIPENPTDYLHRVGRTGRNGKTGVSVLIADKYEMERVARYEKAFGIKIERYLLSKGNIFQPKAWKENDPNVLREQENKKPEKKTGREPNKKANSAKNKNANKGTAIGVNKSSNRGSNIGVNKSSDRDSSIKANKSTNRGSNNKVNYRNK